MTKGVYAAGRIVLRLVAVGEDDARSSQRAGDHAGLHDSIADSAGRLIAAATNHRRTGFEPGLLRGLRSNLAGDVARFVNRGQDFAIQLERFHHFERPASLDDIEQRGTGGIGNIAREIAGELKADVIFRQQHFPDALKIGRLIVADPQQLRQREAGEHGIGGVAQHRFFAHSAVDEIHLWLAALIAPDERRPDHPMRRIQNHQPVHLPGQSHAADILARDFGFCKYAADGLPRGIPPILRPLLGPQRMQHEDILMQCSGSMPHLSTLVYQESARASSSDIDSEPISHEAEL